MTNRYEEAANHAYSYWLDHDLLVRLYLRPEGVEIHIDDDHYIVSHLLIDNANINPVVLMIDQMFKDREK